MSIEPEVSLSDAVKFIVQGCFIKLDYRRDFPNYGEVLGVRNPADHCRWDVFIPGFGRPLKKGRYRVSHILGVIKFENGNHKIVVKLQGTHPGSQRIAAQIPEYIDKYEKLYGRHGEFHPLYRKCATSGNPSTAETDPERNTPEVSGQSQIARSPTSTSTDTPCAGES